MSELQKVNHLIEVDNTDDTSLKLNQLRLSDFAKLKPDEISETVFLEDPDQVILMGKSAIKPENKANNSAIDFKVYSTSEVDLYSYLDKEITREADGMLKFAKNMYFNDKENVLYLDEHVVGVPKGSDGEIRHPLRR